MSQINPQQNLDHQTGIIYNSKRPIGGIRYYPKNSKRTVKVKDTRDPKKVTVEIERKFREQEKKFKEQEKKIEKITLENYKNKEQQEDSSTNDKIFAKKLEKLKAKSKKFDEQIAEKREGFFKRKFRKLRSLRKQVKDFDDDGYVVTLSNHKVNFAKEGIRKPKLSRGERKWLAKAQNYFVTAREKGKRVGSAESYTSMEILEALWATAETVGVDPKRFIVQIYNESRFNPYARGRSGERGIGQFKRSTAHAHGYDWGKMSGGAKHYAYQAKAAAEFVKQVGEVAYNGKGHKARKYKDKISRRISEIRFASSDCPLKNVSHCQSNS